MKMDKKLKFGRIVLQVNTHQLAESNLQFDVTLSWWWPWRHFTQKSAATCWVQMQRLPDTYTASFASSWSIEHSCLLLINCILMKLRC